MQLHVKAVAMESSSSNFDTEHTDHGTSGSRCEMESSSSNCDIEHMSSNDANTKVTCESSSSNFDIHQLVKESDYKQIAMESSSSNCEVGQEGYSGVEEPFSKPDSMSDLVLVVEGIKLYVIKGILTSHSPVFQKMFSSEFKEKYASEVPLHGKKLDAMVKFLIHIHPILSLSRIKASDLQDLLPLADEYQCDHIRTKCQQFIGSQVATESKLSTDNVVFYLWMCELHNLNLHRDDLVNIVAGKDLNSLEKCQHFQFLSLQTKSDLMRKRCLTLEEKYSSQTLRLNKLTDCLEDTVKDSCRYGCERIFPSFGAKDEFCKKCIGRKIKKILKDVL